MESGNFFKTSKLKSTESSVKSSRSLFLYLRFVRREDELFGAEELLVRRLSLPLRTQLLPQVLHPDLEHVGKVVDEGCVGRRRLENLLI